jgi:hypothetical protein
MTQEILFEIDTYDNDFTLKFEYGNNKNSLLNDD